jgi:putative lipoic acid-binding regulatory protein
VFDALVKYPCFFTVKAVGTRDDTFADDIRLAVMEGLQLKENEITIETKTRVKYQSMTLRVYVRNADQLYEVYRIIDADERTKFKF